jgi:hypothetical protein
MLIIRNVATGTYIRSGKPLISLTFILKILVTKENSIYRKASRIAVYPYYA